MAYTYNKLCAGGTSDSVSEQGTVIPIVPELISVLVSNSKFMTHLLLPLVDSAIIPHRKHRQQYPNAQSPNEAISVSERDVRKTKTTHDGSMANVIPRWIKVNKGGTYSAIVDSTSLSYVMPENKEHGLPS